MRINDLSNFCKNISYMIYLSTMCLIMQDAKEYNLIMNIDELLSLLKY